MLNFDLEEMMSDNDEHARMWNKGASGIGYDHSGNYFSWKQGKDHHDALNTSNTAFIAGGGDWGFIGKTVNIAATLLYCGAQSILLFGATATALEFAGIDSSALKENAIEFLVTSFDFLYESNDSGWVVFAPFMLIAMIGVEIAKRSFLIATILTVAPVLAYLTYLCRLSDFDAFLDDQWRVVGLSGLYTIRLWHARRNKK